MLATTTDDIVTMMFFDPARAFKLTLKRSWAQGSVGERDTFGAQLLSEMASRVGGFGRLREFIDVLGNVR